MSEYSAQRMIIWSNQFLFLGKLAVVLHWFDVHLLCELRRIAWACFITTRMIAAAMIYAWNRKAS